MSIHKIREDLILTITDGEAVILDIVQGKYFGLDEVGLFIWKHMDSGKEIKEIEASLVEFYEVDRDTVRKDISDFILDIGTKGLLMK